MKEGVNSNKMFPQACLFRTQDDNRLSCRPTDRPRARPLPSELAHFPPRRRISTRKHLAIGWLTSGVSATDSNLCTRRKNVGWYRLRAETYIRF